MDEALSWLKTMLHNEIWWNKFIYLIKWMKRIGFNGAGGTAPANELNAWVHEMNEAQARNWLWWPATMKHSLHFNLIQTIHSYNKRNGLWHRHDSWIDGWIELKWIGLLFYHNICFNHCWNDKHWFHSNSFNLIN